MKKSVLIVTILLLLSLVAATSASAGLGTMLPTWEEVFDDDSPFPGWYEADDTALQFKGRVYFKFFGEDIVDQTWSTKDGKNWSLAWDAPSIDPEFENFWPMIVFQNQLYLVLRDGDGEYADRIVRTPNGKNWETVAIAQGDEGLMVGFGRFMIFNGQLYIYVGNWDEENNDYSEHLWRSASGDPGSWEEVAQFSCGMRAFATFRDALYIGSDWCDLGVQIWRSFDGVNWEAVTTDGFEMPSNLTVGDFSERGGYLYVGLANPEGGRSGAPGTG